ncbi:diguanylate cyclase [Allorhizobium ampelinum]|nr:EAL domain-containing protein [Allorhizobium ampelinum]NSZ41865.1 EAL domain-containing protein [Agrobacterium vitis]NTA25574.1 EAL domain-containing protein [Allorhizobium ampelinum]OVE96285.1 diguanylate cyclase [Allorhizobium ampelinum]
MPRYNVYGRIMTEFANPADLQTRRSSNVAMALLALAFVLLTSLLAYIGYLNITDYRGQLRRQVQADLQRVSGMMTQRTEENFFALRHLVHALSPLEGALASPQTEGLVRGILRERPEFRALALARGTVIEQVWTQQGLSPRTSMTIGSDSDTDMLLLDDGQLQLDLTAADVTPSPIHVRAILDTAKFIQSAIADGATAPVGNGPAIEIAVMVQTASGARTVFGSPSLAAEDLTRPDLAKQNMTGENPEILTMALQGGTLQVYGRPRAGWQQKPQDHSNFVMTLVAVDLAFAAPLCGIAMLFISRAKRRRALQQMEDKYRALTRRFELAMDSSNIGMWELATDNPTLHQDSRAAQLHGSGSGGDLDQDMTRWLETVHPEDRAKAQAHVMACQQGENSQDYRVVLESGVIRTLRSVGSHADASGHNRVTGLVWDITADVAMQNDLRAAKESSDIKNAELELALDELSIREQQLESLSYRFELALDSYGCGVWEHDFSTGHTVWDERMCYLYNIPATSSHITDALWLSKIHKDDHEMLMEAARNAVKQHTRLNTSQRVLLDQGGTRWVRSVGQVHVDRNGRKKLIGISFDVTADVLLTEELRTAKAEAEARNIELELTKNRIEFNALHDPLTGLANRRKLDIALDSLTRQSQANRSRFTILHLDLDRFKEINDTLGHAAGDAMLVNAARVLSRHMNSGDLVARIGGDEFVVLLHGPIDAKAAAELAERIIQDINIPVDFEGFICRCGVSIGIAEAKGLRTDARKILINADLALYEAKRQGRNCFQFFTDNLQANIVSSKRIADELLHALENDEITAWYQPQFCANSMQLVGAEALVRWQHPTRGILPSNSFLKVAEDLNVMARIDQIVLELALKDKMRWAAMGVKLPKISVNVSSRRLHDAGLIETLESLSISPGEISFELVESIFLDESEDIATTNIERIKALGIDIEIDDFGTGHTSIISLLKLQPKRLKIDRQLVMPLLNSSRERAMVRSIIDIARSLGVATVAEGVESTAHAQILRELGCDLLQGYAFAKPLPFEEFGRFALQTDRQMAS